MRAALLLLFFTSLWAVPQQTAVIEGTILRSDGGGPVAGARVYLWRESPGGNGAYGTMSGSDGRFVLKDVVPGTYKLLAKQAGYIDAEYGQKRAQRPGTPIDISAGQGLQDLNVRMTPGSVVSGRVFDQNGNPIPNAGVQLLQPRYTPDGHATAIMAGSAETNDMGEYRIFRVSPGTYYVAATVRNRALMLDPIRRSASEVWSWMPPARPLRICRFGCGENRTVGVTCRSPHR